MRLSSRAVVFFAVLLTLLAFSTTVFAAIHTTATPKARVTTKVDESKRTTLSGHVPAAVRGPSVLDMGRVEASTPVEHLIMVLKSDEEQKREVRRILDEQQDKRTANYHQWATPEEFGEHFGVHDSDIAQITAWLSSHGMTVEGVSKSKRTLHFSGTIGQLESAFQTEMHHFLMPNGETHVSNSRDISVPTALRTVIAGVPTLNDFFRQSHRVDVGRYSKMKLGPKYTSSSSVHYVSAADFATIYNTAPLLAQGINGSGIVIGVVGRSDILLSDVQSYRQMMGLPPNDPNFIHAGQDNGIQPGDDGESDLDVEISGGMAPGATVDFVIGTPSFLVDGITTSIEYLVENNLTDIISLSYGSCEAVEGAGGNSFNAQMWEQAAAQGISVFVAAGDNGPAGCDDQSTQTYEVLGYATGGEESTWYSVAVGGTEFYGDQGSGYSNYWSATNASNMSSALKYIPEYPWNEAGKVSPIPSGDTGSDLWSGSGGISAYYLRPPWQTGSGINISADPALTLANGAAGNWVASVNITNAGSGYTTAPSVSFGSGCTGAPAATSVLGSGITSGQVVGITFTGYTSHFQGFNCTSVPSVTFGAAPGGGTTATGVAVLGQMQYPPYLITGVPHRLTPDLALNAASGHDATFFCSEGVCELNSSGGLVDAGLVGGTSVAAPSMAGVQALIDQANGGRQGMPAYFYYTLANQQNATNCNSSNNPVNSSNCVFQDVTLGNDFICGLSGSSCSATLTAAKIGFAAGSRYDMATGLGSPNAANLASQWSSVVFNSSNTTLNLSSTSFTHGTSITLNGTVAAASGTPTGDVAFIVSQGAIGDTVDPFGDGSLTGPVAFATLSGGSYSATLNNLPAGTYYVTARYGGDDNFASSLSSGVQVTVGSEGSGLTITPYALSGSACTITSATTFAYGSNILINLGVAGISGAGAPTGTVILNLDGTPIATLALDPNGLAFALSGAITNSSCIYDYNFDNVNSFAGGTHTLTASYSGDGTYSASTATPVSITVTQNTPTLTLAAGATTMTSGASEKLVATFGGLTGINGNSTLNAAPTGTVTFTDTTTSTVLGTASVVSTALFSGNNYTFSAYAPLTTTGITTSGANSITATYNGDSNWATVTSAAATVTVTTGTATSVAVTSNGNPTTLNGRPTLTATVTTATAGSVTFYDGTSVLGAGSTVGTAHTSTFRVASGAAFWGGAHNITAVYSGSGASMASTSPVFVQTVTQGTNAINLTAKTTGTTAQNYTFAAVLTPSQTNATYAPNQGVVNFFDGATNIGSGQPMTVTSAQGGYALWTGTLTTTLAAGTHTITAQYSDINYSLGTSNAQTVTVGGTQTLSWTTPPPASAVYNSSFTVAASASSGLTPAYTSFGKCTNSGATYTMTSGTGTCLVIVNQAGNSSFGPAAELQQSVSATLAANTVTFTTPAPASAEYGSTFTVAASGLGTGAITYTSDGVVCTNSGAIYTIILGSGTCTVGASQAADSNYTSATATPESVTAAPANASVSVTSSSVSNTSYYGASVTFTATVTTDTGEVKGRKSKKQPKDVNGQISWSANTGCSANTVSGTPPQTATCTTTSLPTGSDPVTATYAANDGNHNSGGNGSVTQTVNPAPNTVTFTTPAPASAEYGSTFTVAASGLGTGAITYTSDGVVCTNSGATYTMIEGSGTCVVTATQAADTNYQTASASENVTAAPAQANVGVTSSAPSGSTYGQSVTFTATVGSDTGQVKGRRTKRPKDVNGSVSWSANTGCIASTVSGTPPQTATCTTTALGGGTDTVTATYTANDSNHTTASGSVSQTVSASNNTVTFTTPPPPSAEYGANFTVAASGLGTGAITYTSDGVVCTNSGATYTMISGTGTCTVTATQAADINYQSASASASVTAAAANATVSVTSSAPSGSTYGQSVTFTASIGSDTGQVKGRKTTKRPKDLNGSVAWTWTDASNNVYQLTSCNSAVSGNPTQTLTCSTSALTGGTDTVTATYTASDSNHNSGVSGSASQTVNPAANTVTISGAPSSAEYGSSFTVSASGLGTGAITYGSSGACSNSGATYTMTSGSGTCVVTATQAADQNYLSGSASANVTAQPANASVSVSLTSGSNPSSYGQSLTFTASIGSDTGQVKGRKATKRPKDLNGSVAWTWTDANNNVYPLSSCNSTVSGNPTQTLTCSTSALTGGADTVTATYTAADSNHTTATGSASQTVDPASQTITFTTNPPATAVYGTSFTVAATASSGLTVAFTAAGGCSVVDNNNGSATYTMTSGSTNCSVKANQSGNANYSAAAQVTKSAMAVKANQTITVNQAAPTSAPYEETFTIAGTASSTLTVTYGASGACTVSSGTYTMTAKSGTCFETMNQAGNANYYAAPTITESTTVAAAAVPTVSLTGAPTSEPYNSSFTVTATSNETGNQTSTPVLTATPATVCSLSNVVSGPTTTATVTMVIGTGTCTLKAAWAANNAYKAASVTKTIAATKITPTVTFTGAPGTAAKSSTFTVTATSDETGTYAKVPTISGTTGVCTVGAVTSNGSGGYQATVTMKAATGTCTTKASWATSNGYAAETLTQTTTAN